MEVGGILNKYLKIQLNIHFARRDLTQPSHERWTLICLAYGEVIRQD
jgi:hypothetical protein